MGNLTLVNVGVGHLIPYEWGSGECLRVMAKLEVMSIYNT